MARKQLDVKLKHTYLAIVLLDLVGSTAFVQKVGPIKAVEDGYSTMTDWQDLHAISIVGEKLIALMDLMSFENMSDAVSFALEYNKKVSPKTKLQARIGIHWGSIVEVHQDELYVGVGAKKVELEGIAKNIAKKNNEPCESITNTAHQRSFPKVINHSPHLDCQKI